MDDLVGERDIQLGEKYGGRRRRLSSVIDQGYNMYLRT